MDQLGSHGLSFLNHVDCSYFVKITYQPAYMHTPETEAQIYDILRHAKAHSESVKVVGRNHSPNDVLHKSFFPFH